MRALLLAALVALATACSDDAAGLDAGAPAGRAIVAGEGIGGLRLGMTWAQARALLGDPPADPVVLVRLGHVRWPAGGLEALLVSPAESSLADDAIVIGVAATAAADFTGPARPGLDRVAIEAALGVAPETYGGRAYYPSGLAVEYGEDGATATKVAVLAAYTLEPEPPPMGPARTRAARAADGRQP